MNESVPVLRRDPKVDWDAVELLVDAAIRREEISIGRGAEILGLSLRTWLDRAHEIATAGCPACGHERRHHGRGGRGEECVGRGTEGRRCGCKVSAADTFAWPAEPKNVTPEEAPHG